MAMIRITPDRIYKIEKVLIPNDKITIKSKKSKEITSDIAKIIPSIMKECDAGKSIDQIAKKHKLSSEFTEKIVRMYLTHPGVDVNGILDRI